MTLHHFTVDVEEYFHAGALEPYIARSEWSRLEPRVSGQVLRLLEMLALHGARGTFFTLGWVAKRHPGLLRWIVGLGHELASHGWDHKRVTAQSPNDFRESVRRSKAALEDLSGVAVLGFRAPNFSIVPGLELALDVLLEEGYRYDSSLYPIRRPGYGYPSAAHDPHRLMRPGGEFWEVPPATLSVLGASIPAGGGAYFRLLPYGLVRAALRSAEHRGVPGTFYLHPWELDDEQPRVGAGWFTRMRHYGGVARMGGRVDRLLSEFQFTTVADSLGLQ